LTPLWGCSVKTGAGPDDEGAVAADGGASCAATASKLSRYALIAVFHEFRWLEARARLRRRRRGLSL